MAVRKTQEQLDNETPEERFPQLWLCVLQRALDDACGRVVIVPTDDQTKLEQAAQIEASARHWFETGDRDFCDVCDLAQLPPQQVQKAALAAIAAHDKLKKEQADDLQ